MTLPAPAQPRAQLSAADLSAEGSATWRMERAVLGALLCRPERIDRIGIWLGAQDFADPRHRAVFATIAGLHAAGELRPVPDEFASVPAVSPAVAGAITLNVVDVREALESQRFADIEPASARAVVPDLYRAGQNVGQDKLPFYGKRIVGMSARRQIEAWGIRIEQAATSDAVAGGDVGVFETTRAAMMENLADLAIQVRRANGEVVARLERNPVEVPLVEITAPPKFGLVKRAEEQLIHAVIADPQWHGLLDRLRPEDFLAFAGHENTWRAMQELRRRDEPTDPMMVGSELEAVVAVPGRDGARLSMDHLMTMGTAPPPGVARAVDLVTRSALAQHARLAREELQEVAVDRGQDVGAVLQKAGSAGEGLAAQAQRLAGQRKATSIDERLGTRPVVAPSPHQGPATRTR